MVTEIVFLTTDLRKIRKQLTLPYVVTNIKGNQKMINRL